MNLSWSREVHGVFTDNTPVLASTVVRPGPRARLDGPLHRQDDVEHFGRWSGGFGAGSRGLLLILELLAASCIPINSARRKLSFSSFRLSIA